MPPPPPPPTSSLLLTTTTVLHFHTFTAASPQTGREMAVAFFFFQCIFFPQGFEFRFLPDWLRMCSVSRLTITVMMREEKRKKKRRKLHKEPLMWTDYLFCICSICITAELISTFHTFRFKSFFFSFSPPLFPLGIWSWWALLKDWNRKVIVFSCSCSVTGFSFLPK